MSVLCHDIYHKYTIFSPKYFYDFTALYAFVSLTISDIAQPLEHVLVAAAERVFRPFQQLQLDVTAGARSLPAGPTGALHGPECNHHLPFGSSLAVLL